MGRYISISFLVSSCGFRVLDSANPHACMPNLISLESLVFPEQNTEDGHTLAESVASTLQ